MSYRSLPKAQVTPMQVVRRKPLAAVTKEPPKEPERKKRTSRADEVKKAFAERLTRNVAVAAALLLCAVAIRNAALPDAQGAFDAIQQGVTLNLDETLGKLTFVSSLLPESALVFLNTSPVLEVSAPVNGNVVHAWSANEPYIGLKGISRDVRAAADGEVMAVAHGDNEEKIIRIRHSDGMETIYYNLETSLVSEGDPVYEGDVIGQTADQQPVYFELRRDGRSIDPTSVMKEAVTVP